MKITKQNLMEDIKTKENLKEEDAETQQSAVKDDDLAVDNVKTVSDTELADAVKNSAEEASDGAETYSDSKATAIAKEIKTHANGFDAAAWAPLDVPSELTDKLDDCLANAMVAHASKTSDGVDLLVTGLPGSGKTGITKQWANDRGVNLFYLNAKNDDLGAILNGFPVDTVEKDADGNEVHKVTRSFSKSLDNLEKEKSVLFLDEFNRAAPKLRAVLLSLINEHVVDGNGPDGFKHFDNLLFTVACINPSIPTDPGAMDLNDAEMSRFADTIDWDSNVEDAHSYLVYHLNTLIDDIDPKDENFNFFYTRYNKILNLTNALLTDPRFDFDTRDDLLDLFNDKAKMLNQRSLTDALMAHGYDKKKFLNWVDRYSSFLEKDKLMIHEILDAYVEIDIPLPGETSNNTNATQQPKTTNTAKASTEDSDFDSVFGAEGEEVDTDLFGDATNATAQAAKVNAADAKNRIKNFDYSI